MKFTLVLLGCELFSIEFAMPSRGIYEVPSCPEFYDAEAWGDDEPENG